MFAMLRILRIHLLVSILCLSWHPLPAAAPPQTRPGVVLVVGGAGGFDNLAASAQWAFPRADVPHEVREFVWTHGWGEILKDLQDTRHLLLKAKELTAEIQKIQTEDPKRPVFLIGKSTGAAIVLAAAEQLPVGSLERIILLSPAVSPTYNLSAALKATRAEMVSFHSKHDRLVLGWGTSEFGTADRVYTASAGLRGFDVPTTDKEERELYRRLIQVPWTPRLAWTGHVGGHLGASLPLFLYQEVTPWLRPVDR
jgi:pimeloyl-ACP methyl ester carboxylesterase